MNSIKCINANCQHRVIGRNPKCSYCRASERICNKCIQVMPDGSDCGDKCSGSFCRRHAPRHYKLNQCAYILPIKGLQCDKMCRGDFCNDHNDTRAQYVARYYGAKTFHGQPIPN